MKENSTFKYEPAAVFLLSTGTYVARYLDSKPECAKQVTRSTNADFAMEIANEMNNAKRK
tara:strand:- start:9582 stop:9761 length:180 start_codon:yes stop_codon:yes gene_type:complete